jgi:hypothetical protein
MENKRLVLRFTDLLSKVHYFFCHSLFKGKFFLNMWLLDFTIQKISRIPTTNSSLDTYIMKKKKKMFEPEIVKDPKRHDFCLCGQWTKS